VKNRKQPEIRFDNYTDEWKRQALKHIVDRVTRKNKDLKTQLPLTISAQYGLVDQVTYFNKQIASKDMSNYYLLERGEFAYNKSYSRDYPWGAIKRLDNYDMGALSSLYITFKPLKINSDFLLSYYDTNKWHKEVSTRATEGARNHGLLNISANDFLETELAIPLQEEQENIGSFFKQLDEAIYIHQQELDTLKQIKQGFLQKMFPKEGESVPELRFPDFVAEWEKNQIGEIATIVRGASPRPIQDPKWFDKESKVGWLRISDVTRQDGRIHYLGQRISIAGQEKTRVLKEPHLLLSIAATVGKPVINYVETGVHDGFLIFLNPKFDIEFMFQWLEMFRPRWNKYGQPGSQVNLNSELVKSHEIYLPGIEEQIQIGKFFKQLDEVIALHQQELDALKQTKKAFLQKMFV